MTHALINSVHLNQNHRCFTSYLLSRSQYTQIRSLCSSVIESGSLCLSHLSRLLLPTLLTLMSLAVVGLQLIGYTRAFVNSWIDYCNTVLAGAPRTIMDRLQRVLNAAARVVNGTCKFDHGGLVRYCTTNFTGSTSRVTGCSSS